MITLKTLIGTAIVILTSSTQLALATETKENITDQEATLEISEGKISNLSATYALQIKNSSATKSITLVTQSSNCMYDSGDKKIRLEAGQTYLGNLKDNNNWVDGCTNETKTVDWSVNYINVANTDTENCTLTFRHGRGHANSDGSGPEWYTLIKGCPDIVENAICGGQICYNSQAFWVRNRSVNIEFSVK
ncbi:hypothetical protein [Photorhabdus aegyptia]|uniref:hypothetical protein n=1 Tax=Photorhabdus aegyptia TaxID=2805098 RepID=UPI001E3EFC74|nr:hypothetical protein [Photorhabdus aegyptia]MCC8460339.1 hypothetical protein [Photorhabdus aegyptia]